MARLWDISQKLHPGVPLWPGEPAFGLRQMLLLVPAAVALALVLKEPVIAELMAYSLLIYGAWAVLGRGNAQNKEKNR